MDKLLQLTTDMGKLWSQYGSGYLDGAKNTLLLAVIATAIGCVIGLLCGILQTIPHSKTDNPFKRFFLALVRLIIRVYVEVFRGTPMILQAVFIYFGLPYFTNNTLSFSNVWAVSILVVSINTGAYMAESVRGGILS
ncbi:MAG: ABC transporter permease subunit, partial [Oscillibacter sp.]